MLEFSTETIIFKNNQYTYKVNLLADRKPYQYKGRFVDLEIEDTFGEVFCEVFENKYKYFLTGTWLENETIFKWFAEINK
jgi:hypothetical protein